MTSFPVSAKQVPTTRPTYPVPITLIFKRILRIMVPLSNKWHPEYTKLSSDSKKKVCSTEGMH
jgi:hypothetical protein